MKKLIIKLMTLLLLISCKGEPQSSWKLNAGSELEGITYQSADDQSVARILSIKELEKLAFRKIGANGRNSHQQQLEFALSVLAIDVDELKTVKNNAIPMLYGNGYSTEGEVTFAITYKEQQPKNIVVLVSKNKEFNSAKEISVLIKNNFDFSKHTSQLAQSKTDKNNKSQIKNTSQKKYPLPLGVKNKNGKVYWKGWHYKDDLHARASKVPDPGAPKFAMEVIKIATAKSKKIAINKALAMNNVKNASYEKLKRMDISKTMLGNDMFFTIGKSKLAGQDAVLFLRIEKVKNKLDYYVLIIEIPKKTYITWGGISSILLATQVISSMNSIPPKRKQQIASATPLQQMQIYEAAYTSIMQQYYRGIMMTKSQTLLRMQELNYDLLLGGDITDPMIGN